MAEVRKQYRCSDETCAHIFSEFKERNDETIPACQKCGKPAIRDFSGVQVSMPHIHAPGGLKDWTKSKSVAEQADVYLGDATDPY